MEVIKVDGRRKRVLNGDILDHGAGAIQLVLAEGVRAYFKPCNVLLKNSPGSEYWESEILAYAIDQTVGFNRTAVAVERQFSVASLRGFLRDEEAIERLEETGRLCGDNGILTGALIGWFRSEVRVREALDRGRLSSL